MILETKDLFYVIGIIITALVTFFGTKHDLKERIRDLSEKNNEKINDLRIEIEKLRSRDALQQQTLDTFQNQVMNYVPKLFQIIENSKKND